MGTRIILLIFLLFCTAIQFVICERIYIVASSASPCPPEFDKDHCLTLQQYASNSTFDSSNEISLELEPGNHSLNSLIRVTRGNSFVLKSIDGTVVCSTQLLGGIYFQGGRISISYISYVHISGITFIGCDQNVIFRISELLIEDVHIKRSSLSIFRTTNATIIKSLFSDNTCSNPFACTILAVTTSSLQLKMCSFSNSLSTSPARGIDNDNSDMIIENSSFRHLSGRNGGAIRITNGRNRTLEIINSTFHDNIARQLGGGAIYIINSSNITLEGCTFVNNTAMLGSGGGGGIFATGINISVSISQTDFNNNSARFGGAVAVTDGIITLPHIVDRLYPYTRNSISISQSKFIDNSAENGGAMTVSGRRSLFTLTQSSFFSNTAFRTDRSGSGGAVLVSGKNSYTLIDHSDFMNNEADEDGGAVCIFSDGSSVSVRISTFDNNSARHGSGGAISHSIGQSTDSSIDKSIFSKNKAAFCGALDVVQVTVTSTLFIHNRATTGPRSSNTWKTRGGGAICTRDSSTLSNSTFNHNIAEESSAGVLNTFSGVRVEGSTFDNNEAGRDGGVILHHTANLTIIQSNFTNNHADGDGGVIHGNRVSIDNANFYNNRAESGGSLFIRQAVISEGNFINNKAIDDGGAIYLSCTFCSITEFEVFIHWSNFINNVASQGVGGAIFITRHNISLTENIFSYNSASSCGVVGASWIIHFTQFRSYNLNVSKSTFTHNRATAVQRDRIGGGGVMCLKSGYATIVDSQFNHNTARGNGGVMEVDNSTVLIQGTLFDNNTARYNGGVTHTSSYLPATFRVFQCSFTNNKASIGNGGVFYLHRRGSKLTIRENSLNYNHAGSYGGVFSVEGTRLTVNATSMNNNTARRGSVISTCNSNITIQSSDTYSISQRAQVETCFFYDIRHTTVEPSSTVPFQSFSSESMDITITPSEVTPSISTNHKVTSTTMRSSTSVRPSSSMTSIYLTAARVKTKSATATSTPALENTFTLIIPLTKSSSKANPSSATMTTSSPMDASVSPTTNDGIKLHVDIVIFLCTFTIVYASHSIV